jgi:hypothetical protein
VIASLFDWMRERESIRRRRAAAVPFPWTRDEILSTYHFCNVRREDDAATAWFRENVRQPLRNDPVPALRAAMIFRWFNRPDVGVRLLAAGAFGRWDRRRVEAELRRAGPPWVERAYIINTPGGMDKLAGVCQCIDWAMELATAFGFSLQNVPLEEAHRVLSGNIRHMGPFLAYEVVSDLRHTKLLERARDIDTWAHAGPGAVRGLNRVLGRPVAAPMKQAEALAHMRALLNEARILVALRKGEAPFEMREIEHSLCEYDKYRRAADALAAGERPRLRRFRVGGSQGVLGKVG